MKGDSDKKNDNVKKAVDGCHVVQSTRGDILILLL